jgi:hypothetical protein
MAKSNRTGHDYVSLLINTPDGDLRVNAVQNEEQRGGQTFSSTDRIGEPRQRGSPFFCLYVRETPAFF